MATSYDYSISTDFTSASQVNISELKNAITADPAINIDPSYISSVDDTVTIHFPSSLSSEQKTALDSLVSAYTYVETKTPYAVSYDTFISNNEYIGEYSSIADAFANGKTSLFVKNGTYYESSDIIIPNGGQLFGELPGKTIIYLVGSARVVIDGSGGVKETTGTISIVNNSKIVTGSGTTFTNLASGQYIRLGTNYYEIDTVDSNIQLTLKEVYVGTSLTNNSYQAQAMFSGCRINNFNIVASSSTGLYIRGVRHSGINSVAISKCGTGLEIVDCGDLSIKEVITTYSGDSGVKISNSVSLSLHTINVFNSLSHGIYLSGINTNVVINSCASENNNGCGLYINNSSECTHIIGSIFKNNNSDGVYSTSNTMHMVISGCEVSSNNGIGFNITGSYNEISNCCIEENNTDGIITGHGCIINGCIITECTNGIKMISGSNNCCIDGNNVSNNSGYGIQILSNNCGINGNNINNNGTDGIYIDGTKNRISNNTVVGNGERGIHILGTASNNVVNGNIIDTSTGNGLEIITGSTNNIVTSNNILDNTGSNFVDSGTGTVGANNITA